MSVLVRGRASLAVGQETVPPKNMGTVSLDKFSVVPLSTGFGLCRFAHTVDSRALPHDTPANFRRVLQPLYRHL